ncbi:protein-L-isoaspartate O-methyltransferase family protein [Halocalculus aciditolerans]|uniref:protein-L-isoaspartate(D-aspartate) O-methyltransferase n=1 Tax=Halocalculus aciditolerans TaxID=1383812 RepID=A0A830F6S5_9EURY|nr:protein-L-isoaspartate O-methyltransferase [Halocalculus aciditolerans]GGL68715.1 protein-L-isoaspartate O-methyltransferase [Halocalculus aciditolerans]
MEYAAVREDMVASLEHDTKRVVRSRTLGDAMRSVPRHEFVETDVPHRAYADRSFEHQGTRVLSPATVGRLFEALDVREDDSVLVVGAGVGYTAAVAAELTSPRHVHAIDISRRLVYDARTNLDTAGYGGVLVDQGDGAEGLDAYAPFDRILVEAAAVAPPDRLRRQLTDDGRLVLPTGDGAGEQTLAVYDRAGTRVDDRGPATFAPLLVDGEQTGVPIRNRTHREDVEHAERAMEKRPGWEHDWIDWD